MQSPLVFLRGMYKSVLRVDLTKFHQVGRDERRRCLCMEIVVVVASIALCTCMRRVGSRSVSSCRGQWTQLLIASRDCPDRAQSQHRRRRTQTDTIERRAERAEALVHLGELSSGRHALEGAPLARGNEETRRGVD